MNEREFVERRLAHWERLAAILRRAASGAALRTLTRPELKDVGPLYRRAASDLAYARVHAVSPALVTYLNDLAARSYALLYHTETRQWRGLPRFFTHDFPRTFRRRINYFLASLGFMLLGAAVGYVMVARQKSNINVFFPEGSQLRDSVKYWESGKVTHHVDDSEAATYAAQLMTNNITVSIVAFAGGILMGTLTAYAMFQNGAVLGSMAGLMTQVHQHGNFWPGILPHGVVELSETVIAGAAGLAVGWALLAPGRLTRRDALVAAALDSVKLVIGGAFLLIFAGLVEGFVSHSLLPKPLKLGFGIASGLALYSYLFMAGRKDEAAPGTVADSTRTVVASEASG